MMLIGVILSAEKCIQDLLRALTCQPLSPLQHLETKQALAKQFAEILHFTLKFDDLKVSRVVNTMTQHAKFLFIIIF